MDNSGTVNMKRKYRYVCGIISIMLAALLAGCSDNAWIAESTAAQSADTTERSADAAAQSSDTAAQESELQASRDVFAMDTYMTVTCYGTRCEEAADAAVAEIRRLDELLSAGDPDSETGQLNSHKEGKISKDSQIMIDKSIDLWDQTGGAFDITVYPVMDLWGFTDGDYRVPDSGELEQILQAVDSGQLQLSGDTVKLGKDQGIDLGGIAKGYTSDRIMEIFEEYELTAGLVSLGGNVQLYGSKPDGSPWKCGIRDPLNAEDESALMGVLRAENCAVITSGGYERFFEDDEGNTYHHIIDPRTGYPADNGLISVTIVSASGMLADGLSTACFVLGAEGAAEYWRNSEEDFEMILMDSDKQVYITEGLKDSFSTGYAIHVITESE